MSGSQYSWEIKISPNTKIYFFCVSVDWIWYYLEEYLSSCVQKLKDSLKQPQISGLQFHFYICQLEVSEVLETESLFSYDFFPRMLLAFIFLLGVHYF